MSLEGNIILKHLDDFNQSIKDTLVRKGISDTGSAAASLKTKQDGNKYQSVGNDYIEVLDKGRGPGKFAPPIDIQAWVMSKLGITGVPELKQVAYAVNLKIKQEGTAIYKDNSKGLEIDDKIARFTEPLVKDLQVFAVADIKKKLDKFKSARI